MHVPEPAPAHTQTHMLRHTHTEGAGDPRTGLALHRRNSTSLICAHIFWKRCKREDFSTGSRNRFGIGVSWSMTEWVGWNGPTYFRNWKTVFSGILQSGCSKSRSEEMQKKKKLLGVLYIIIFLITELKSECKCQMQRGKRRQEMTKAS